MSDEMEKQSVDETTDVADTVETTETVEAEENAAESTETVPAEENAAETQAEVVAEQPAQGSPVSDTTDKPAMKKNVKMWIAAAAVVALIAIIANAPKIGNAAVKLLTSPAGYFQHLLKNASDEGAEQFAENYDTALERLIASDDMSSETEISVTLGEDAREMLEDATNMDFDWMEKLSFLVNADSAKDAIKLDLGLALNDNRLFSMLLTANLKDKMAYLKFPELNEFYLGMDLEEVWDQKGMDFDDFKESTEMYKKLYKALPKKAKVEKLLKRYSKLAISCIEDVEQDKKEVKVGKITNKFTVLEATIDEDALQDILETLVKELKEDKDIKKIIYDVLETQKDADADEVYDEFLDMLDELEDEIDNLDEEKFEIVVKLYADNKGRIMGCVAEVEDENVEVSCLTVQKGRKYASEFEVKKNGVKVVIEGEGKRTSSKLNGDFKLKAAGLKILEFSLEDIKVKDLEDGYFNGTITVSLGSAAAGLLERQLYGIPVDLDDMVMKLKGKSSKKKSEATFSLYEGDKLFGVFSVNSKIGTAGKIKSPKEKEVAMVEGEGDFMDWLQDMDLDAFLESLEGKIDDDVLDMFDGLMNGSISLPGMGHDDNYWYDDNYYDDDYWYEDDYYDDDYWYEDDYYDDDYWYEDNYYDDDYRYEDDWY